MSIEAPNFTQIPNVVFDYWMKKLSPAEFKVLLSICRKIFGWRKKEDKISNAQIEELTGLTRKAITQAVEKLIHHDLIIKIKTRNEHGGDGANEYRISIKNENSNKDLGVTPEGGGEGTEYRGGEGTEYRGGRVLSTPTKETNTKEIEKVVPKGTTTKTPVGLIDQPREGTTPYRDNIHLTTEEHRKILSTMTSEQFEIMLDILSPYLADIADGLSKRKKTFTARVFAKNQWLWTRAIEIIDSNTKRNIPCKTLQVKNSKKDFSADALRGRHSPELVCLGELLNK